MQPQSDRPERLAYFDCSAGVSGDMTLGALIDAGLVPEVMETAWKTLGLGGYRVEVKPVTKQHLAGTGVSIQVTEPQPHRGYRDIAALIEAAALAGPVKALSLRILLRLAEAEAAVHRTSIDQVHFHEIGAVDSILDIVGAAMGLEALGITQVYASPLPMGQGPILCAHGRLPNPAPATALLLQGVPVYGTDLPGELVTPTGAAILVGAEAHFGPCPPMTVESLGYGAGSRDLPNQPNLLRIFIGRPAAALGAGERVLVMESHIDDLPPEIYEHLMAGLFAAGALDVAYSPLQMKKNRPGSHLTVILPPAARAAVLETLFTESTTLGVRIMEVERVVLPRWQETIETPYGPLAVKVTDINGRRRILPEYEACRALASQHKVPLVEIYRLIPPSIDLPQ